MTTLTFQTEVSWSKETLIYLTTVTIHKNTWNINILTVTQLRYTFGQLADLCKSKHLILHFEQQNQNVYDQTKYVNVSTSSIFNKQITS